MSQHRPTIPAVLRRQVVLRSGNRCEYCGLSQLGQEATFHVDHVIPVAAGGATDLENLALACVSCSLSKAARLTAPDPTTGQEIRLFNPRTDSWSDHFWWDGIVVVPKTAIGRATSLRLKMNRALALLIREEEFAIGRHLDQG